MERFTVQRMLINQDAFFLPKQAVSSMQAIWSSQNVLKEPIFTPPWQSVDQLMRKQL